MVARTGGIVIAYRHATQQPKHLVIIKRTDAQAVLYRKITLSARWYGCKRSLAVVIFIVSALLSISTNVSATQEAIVYRGLVKDKTGAAIENATIELRTDEQILRTRTDAAGQFSLPASSRFPKATLIVSAAGFATAWFDLLPERANTTIDIRLEPAPLIERIDVTVAGETAGDHSTLDQKTITRSGAITLDDVLRQAPGFSLFRRSGSLTANPTSQGVSLRGVGANGASRAVVLLDGIPLNNPFGSWIYWNRIPRTSVASVTITNGAASDVYGSGALGGVINIETRQIEKPYFETELSWANENTPTGSAIAGVLVRGLAISASAQALRTSGYILVPKEERGLVDVAAGTADLAGSLSFSRALRNRGRAFLRLNSFGESRRNGTPLQLNDTRIQSIDLGIDYAGGTVGGISARLYGSRETFNQNFTAVSIDRNTESLTNRQRNPSQQFGVAFQWRRSFAAHALVAGFEQRDVRGHSAETTFAAGRVTAQLDAGGRQNNAGFFALDTLHARKFVFTFGGRFDHWTNSFGFANRIPLSGAPSFNQFTDRSENAFSPRLSVMRSFASGISINATFYRAFRAPTLNELYRGFRVGNVVTNANANLRAERLSGVAGGVALQKLNDRLNVRGDFFWNKISDPIANITLTATPLLITRQRQNLGAIRARGLEAAVTYRASDHLQLSAEYQLTDTTVLEFPANPLLEGLLVPQIPRHQFNFQISYNRRKWILGFQGRAVGVQFDDDQNLLPLQRFLTIDMEAARALSPRFEVFMAIQNLTNTRYEIARSPVTNVGPPLLARVGLRIRWP